MDLLPAPPGVVGGAVGGFLNPAAWALGAGELAFTWDDRSLQDDRLDDWGLSIASPLGFALSRRTFLDGRGSPAALWDYRLGVAWGDRGANGGLAWRWTGGEAGAAGAEKGLVCGTIDRPAPWISVGSSAFLSVDSGFREGQLDLGIRPLGTSALTLFADASMTSEDQIGDALWSAGAQVRPVHGLEIGGRVRETAGGQDLEWVLDMGVTLASFGAHVLPSYDKDANRASTTYLVRTNPPFEGATPERLFSRAPHRMLAIDLVDKSVGYKKDLWLDDQRVAWLDLLQDLRRVRDDPGLAGVAIDLSGTRLRPSIAWELRRELDALRDAGKRVYLHFDQMRMGSCYIAGGADRVTLDPQGGVELPGVAIQRTYLKGTLEKMGIGFEEHRLFRYKSAAETLTRRDMSDADKEQLGRLADVLYEGLRDGIASGRGLTPAAVDSLVDRETELLPQRAMDLGLVDAVERWNDLEDWAKGEGLRFVADAPSRAYPDERWGRPPLIALVYAEGVCDVKEGISARATSKYLESLSRRKDVAAVVLRADSPGGDPLAADLVADGLAANRDEGKPVVVTQGDVAGSGGYWISLDADRLLTTPFTITGSIGVISGWAWDAGFGGKTGLSADGVQRGRHADLFGGMKIPLIGARLPLRNLDEDERAYVDSTITALYDEFVTKVADLRELPEETVRELAQGRVWAGADAVDNGLCDDVGGLGDALDDAKTRAGLRPSDEVRIEEYPPRRFFHVPDLFRSVPGIKTLLGAPAVLPTSDDDYEMQYLRALLAAPAAPCLVVPPDDLPNEWKDR
ncbi:MAG: S49 family peptidase [bacterium]